MVMFKERILGRLKILKNIFFMWVGRSSSKLNKKILAGG